VPGGYVGTASDRIRSNGWCSGGGGRDPGCLAACAWIGMGLRGERGEEECFILGASLLLGWGLILGVSRRMPLFTVYFISPHDTSSRHNIPRHLSREDDAP